MDIVQISHTSVDQSLEGSQTDSLNDSCPEETGEVGPTCTSPSAANDDEDSAKQIEMSFAPHPRRSHEQDPSDAHAAQVIPCEQRGLCKVSAEVDRQGDGVGSE